MLDSILRREENRTNSQLQVSQYDIASVLGSVFGVTCQICDSIMIGNNHATPINLINLRNSIGSVLELHLTDQLIEIGRYLRFKSELLSGEGMFE